MRREVSITQHRDRPTSVWIDGVIYQADTSEQIGAVLQAEKIDPQLRINFANARGKLSQVLAGTYLPTAKVRK